MVENELTRAIRELVAEAVKNFALPTKPERGADEEHRRSSMVICHRSARERRTIFRL